MGNRCEILGSALETSAFVSVLLEIEARGIRVFCWRHSPRLSSLEVLEIGLVRRGLSALNVWRLWMLVLNVTQGHLEQVRICVLVAVVYALCLERALLWRLVILDASRFLVHKV